MLYLLGALGGGVALCFILASASVLFLLFKSGVDVLIVA